MTIQPLLPDASDAGLVRRWYLPLNGPPLPSGDPPHLAVHARFLGAGTSHTEPHARNAPHPDGHVPRGVRCNACRWFEARIFRELVLPAGVESLDDLDDDANVTVGEYVVHYAGMSIVPGEVPFYRFETTTSPYAVIEGMTTRRSTDRGPEVYLAKPSARALSEAAGYDVALRDAYENRAVS